MRKMTVFILSIILLIAVLFCSHIFLSIRASNACAKKAQTCKNGLDSYSYKSNGRLFGFGKCRVKCLSDVKK